MTLATVPNLPGAMRRSLERGEFRGLSRLASDSSHDLIGGPTAGHGTSSEAKASASGHELGFASSLNEEDFDPFDESQGVAVSSKATSDSGGGAGVNDDTFDLLGLGS